MIIPVLVTVSHATYKHIINGDGIKVHAALKKSHLAVRVLSEVGVQDGVGDLVAHFVCIKGRIFCVLREEVYKFNIMYSYCVRRIICI